MFLRKKDLLTYLRLMGDYYEDLIDDIESGMFDEHQGNVGGTGRSPVEFN
jgi:hypothetical protein